MHQPYSLISIDQVTNRNFQDFCKDILFWFLDSSYYVRVEYLSETGANASRAYQLPGCPSVDCPFSNFTAIYQPRFPKSADEECTLPPPPTTPYPTQPPPRKISFEFPRKINIFFNI